MLPSTNWNYPTTVWFGHGRVADTINACKELGIKKPLVVTDEALVKLPIFENLKEALSKELDFAVFSDVKPNPTGENIQNGVLAYKQNSNDGVIAFGGGSALDAGKAIALMVGQDLPIWEFEDIGDNYKKVKADKVAPIIAIPTTAGTGSEVGRASVITDSKNHAKKIIFHPKMLPSIVILDPNLTYDLPPRITAWTGIDALVHAIEAYCSPLYHPMAEGIALQAIKMIKENLLKAYKEPHNENARANMLVSAMMGATAFQKGLGSVHSLAHTLGGLYDIPHGLANSIILPYALAQNKDAIEDKMADLCKFLDIKNPSTDSFVEYILDLRKELDIPHSLKEVDINPANAKEIAKIALNDPSTGTNAKKMSEKDFEELFLNAYNGDIKK
jgi:alcohol dehydrogenase class IV